ncbi:monooxygenase 1-like [Papaver somniferum]|uniref:monooxygenase 1-like n=1 Tax=Papaver somniferum TaxID=3469 RepID=UPI000E6FECCE|nr:monooxygenase 1-like [Papaver somniferum]
MITTNYIEEAEIVIVGGGIGGLATALALHKKGLESVINLVGAQLRPRAVPFTALRNISLNNDKQEEIPLREEARCLKRNDLVQVLADSLPPNTVRFGCHILAVKLDPLTSQPILQLQDGNTIKAKVVIGCDGVHSVVSELIGLKPAKSFSTCGVRGFTSYPSGHGLSNEFIRIRKDNRLFGRMPVDDNLLYWFVARPWTSSDEGVSSEPKLIKESTIESITGFPAELIEIVKKCDLDSLTLTRIRYRTPWDILLGNFRKGTVIVAGDAMHVMGPFLGQGGSAALEDAVVLARNLAQAMSMKGSKRMDEKNYAGKD